MKRLLIVLLAAAMSAAGIIAPSRAAIASTVVWNNGDVFAGTGLGNYKIYNNDGTGPKDVINDGHGGITTGCAFNPDGSKLYTTEWTGDDVIVYDAAVPHSILQTIDTSGSGGQSNESVVFANDGSFYVGHADGNGHLMHFSAAGTLLTEFAPARENRGTDWNDLASNQQTMFYTSEGTHVKRFDVGGGSQLSDFNSTPLPGNFAYALRLLPPGDGSGGLLVADTQNILRLDGSGNVVQTYGTPLESNWFALNLDPNGTSFWSGTLDSGNFYRFNIATGAIEVGPVPAGMGNFGAGLCVKGETTAAVSNITLSPASATNPTGTNHTVTATVTTNGKPTSGAKVTFTIISGPDTGASGTCNPPSCSTDTNGQVSFTYMNNGTAGMDTIQACFTDSAGTQHCAKATKTWMGDAPIAAQGTTFTATEGQPFAGTVATVTDGDRADTPVEYRATIDWGDGSAPDTVVLTGPAGGPYNVDGTHTYKEEGTYTVRVHVTDSDSTNTADATSTARVGDAALASACATSFSQQNFNGATATFTDANSFATKADFTAGITWGDGQSSPGTVSGGPGNGPYTVSGSHTYASTGVFTITTTITDDGGSSTVATCKVIVFAFPTSNGATFVIGDLAPTGLRNPLPGDHVTWWGSQWATLNPMTLGPPPASMKGFAGFEDNALGLPPACGPQATWTTDPGNSTPPPATVPDVMGVIVSSHVDQNGSVISGDIKEIVIVQNDPGYAPSPGHPGTGTVLAIVCVS